jgi:hypothetical protein
MEGRIMVRTSWLLVVAAAVLALGAAPPAGTPGELLEKGIYTEETVGDLDKAIAIYQKVVAEAKTVEATAAQAQFHIGQCLSKQGKKGEATAAFEKVINDFPGQKDLVAKARKLVPEGIQLEPAPWVDGETLQLRYRLAGGMDIGTIIYTIQSAQLDGRKIWHVGSRQTITLGQVSGASGVDADWDTFRPIKSFFNMSPMGKFSVEFKPTQLVVTSEGSTGKSTRTIDETELVYDNEQAMDVIRRLPLAVGCKLTLPILGIGGNKIGLPIEVLAKEKVKVPAGEFECFKLHLGLVNQTFWYSADKHRYLVKFDANTVVAELTAIGQLKPGEPRQFEDKKLGLSLWAPNDWFFYAAPPDDKGATKIYFIDSAESATGMLVVAKIADLRPEAQKSLRDWADAVNADQRKTEKDYKVRSESWLEGKVAGLPALSCVADYACRKGKMVDYRTYVRTDSLALTFAASVPREQFDAYRKAFDTIVQSVKVR